MKFEMLYEEHKLFEASTNDLEENLDLLSELAGDPNLKSELGDLNFKTQKELAKHVSTCIKILKPLV